MMQSTTPAVAIPLRGPPRLLIPSTSPVMVVGNPMIGRNQAIRPNRPRHKEAIALPPPGVGMAKGERDAGKRRWHARHHQVPDLRDRAQPARTDDRPPE